MSQSATRPVRTVAPRPSSPRPSPAPLAGAPCGRYRKIAARYLSTWFTLDLAGSFPFDLVVAAAEEASGAGAQNLSGMRLIRTLKLIRAVKWVAGRDALL